MAAVGYHPIAVGFQPNDLSHGALEVCICRKLECFFTITLGKYLFHQNPTASSKSYWEPGSQDTPQFPGLPPPANCPGLW